MSFFGELRRRNVVKVAVAYAVVGWLLIEVSTTVLPLFEAPDWIAQVFAFFVILGFPLALILSWAYELTPEGIKLERDVTPGESITHVTGRKIDFAIIGALVLALGFVGYNYLLEDGEVAAGVLPNSVAVLPFDNLSPDPDEAYFATGLHDEILSQLAKLRNLSVISRTSVLRYADSDLSIPEIARELNVGTVMEGSVRYANDRVRITTQLIDAATDEHLWSETYEREFSDIFAIESDIAMNIANALETEFSAAEQESIETPPTRSAAAYELYLQATADMLDGLIAIQTAHSLLDRAIELDPDFALAYAVKATLYRPTRPEIAEYAQEALSRDPDLPLAHRVLGMQDVYNWRWFEGRGRMERALVGAPNDPQILVQYAWLNAIDGRYDEAIRDAQVALALDPSGDHHFTAALVYLHADRDDEALRLLREANEKNPRDYLVSALRSRLETLHGNGSQGEELARAAERNFEGGGSGRPYVTYALVLAGLQEEAFRFVNDGPGFDVGPGGARMMRAFAGGDQARALDILNGTMETRSSFGPGLLMLVHNLWSDPVLNESAFVAARERFIEALLE